MVVSKERRWSWRLNIRCCEQHVHVEWDDVRIPAQVEFTSLALLLLVVGIKFLERVKRKIANQTEAESVALACACSIFIAPAVPISSLDLILILLSLLEIYLVQTAREYGIWCSWCVRSHEPVPYFRYYLMQLAVDPVTRFIGYEEKSIVNTSHTRYVSV